MREENIEKMNFKELRNEVQYLRDELAMFKRKFNDIIYNLDSDNFGKSFVVAQNNMKAQIKINAQEIATKVSTEDFNSEITQTADKIRSVVAKSSFENEAEEVSDTSDFIDIDKIYVIREYVSGTNFIESETYYFYSGTEWEALKGTDLYTCFEQNASGFKLKGDVSVDGDVVANSLQGETITGTTINGSTINSGSIYSGFFSDSSSQNNKLVLDSNAVHFMRHGSSSSLIDYFAITFTNNINDKNIVFTVAPPSTSPETTLDFLKIYRQSNTIYVEPHGNWDFSSQDCNITWGNNAPSSVAVFG